MSSTGRICPRTFGDATGETMCPPIAAWAGAGPQIAGDGRVAKKGTMMVWIREAERLADEINTERVIATSR